MADDIQKKYLKILLIKSTYKTLLGRPADPDGLKNYYHAISDKSLAESAQHLCRPFQHELLGSLVFIGNDTIQNGIRECMYPATSCIRD